MASWDPRRPVSKLQRRMGRAEFFTPGCGNSDSPPQVQSVEQPCGSWTDGPGPNTPLRESKASVQGNGIGVNPTQMTSFMESMN